VGLGIAGDRYRWPNRTIPCEIDPGFPHPQRLLDAIDHWHRHTSIRFVGRDGEADYLRIVPADGEALSRIGRRGGPQDILLGDSCTRGTIVHELGHTVGLCHEHCRNQREEWIQIDESNIRDEAVENFLQNRVDEVDTPLINLGPYDYASIMHYGTHDCAKYPEDPVITTLQPRGAPIGQRLALSPGDIAAVEELYQGVPMPAGPDRPIVVPAPAAAAPQPAPAAPAPAPAAVAPQPVAAAPQPVPAPAPRGRWAPAKLWAAVVRIGGRLSGRGPRTAIR
jgi:astacin